MSREPPRGTAPPLLNKRYLLQDRYKDRTPPECWGIALALSDQEAMFGWRAVHGRNGDLLWKVMGPCTLGRDVCPGERKPSLRPVLG